MGQIKVTKCPIEGLYIIEPAVHGDARGYFMETYNLKDMQEAGLNMNFVQDNQSMSVKGVLRGLHFQKEYPQGKLVRVIKGRVFDVAVDLRADSKTYGQWYGVELTEENKKQFLIPRGFAHGFKYVAEALVKHGVGAGWKVYVVHADAMDAAQKALDTMKNYIPDAQYEVHPLSPAFITQGGPGCVAIQAVKI